MAVLVEFEDIGDCWLRYRCIKSPVMYWNLSFRDVEMKELNDLRIVDRGKNGVSEIQGTVCGE